MSFWTVVRTHPNCEKIAIHNLERQNFDYYQPKILERKKRKQGMAWVESPLFPCYLFVKVVNRWMSLHSTHGVASVISAGMTPAIVRDSVVDSLRKREDSSGFIQLPKPPMLRVGDTVTIKTGAFAAQTALVERMPVKDRQKVLLALLSNKIRILVDESELEAA